MPIRPELIILRDPYGKKLRVSLEMLMGMRTGVVCFVAMGLVLFI